MNKKLGLAMATGGAMAAVAYLTRKDIIAGFDWAKATAFALAIPAEARPYADDILAVSKEKGVSPLITTMIGYRESLWGQALKPKGPGGTGDFGARGSRTPPAGRGWGHGIMQIDYASWQNWIDMNAWWEPRVNIAKGLDIFLQYVAFFRSKKKLVSTFNGKPYTPVDGERVFYPGSTNRWELTPTATILGNVPTAVRPDPRPLSSIGLLRASLAAYNTGPLNAIRSVAAGKDPDFTTSGGQYGGVIVTRMTDIQSRMA